MKRTTGFLLAAALTTTPPLALSAVEVKYEDIAKYRDAVPDAWHGQAKETDTTLKELRKHIEKLAGKYIPADRTLRVSVLDVDLAGEIKHLGSTLREIRVLSSATWPVIKLRYAVSKDDKIEAQGEDTLSDPNYQQTINAYSNTDPLRYERHMLDEWFARKFSAR